MVLPDINILVYAFRRDSPGHERFRDWLEELINGPEPYGLSELISSGFMRTVTHPRGFRYPSSLDEALAFVTALREPPGCVLVSPGERHWPIFVELCLKANARGNLIADAYLAALAIESGSEWITTDRDFARFPGLRWRHPFD